MQYRTTTRLGGVVFFIALAILVFEVALIRLFSASLMTNLSFLAISTALFGVAFGGIFVYSFMKTDEGQEISESFIKKLLILFGVSVAVFAVVFVQLDFFAHPYLVVLTALLASIPFILGNILLSYVFAVRSKAISFLYLSDLIGAALGVVAAVALLHVTSVFGVMLAACGFSFAGLLYLKKDKKQIFTSLVLILLTLGAIWINDTHSLLTLQYDKTGNRYKDLLFSEWNSFSHVTVESYDDGLVVSTAPESEQIPERYGIKIDGGAFTEIINFNGDLQALKFFDNDIASVAYIGKSENPGNVLIIGPGGGRDVLSALRMGHTVRGVEINPLIARTIMQYEFRDFAGDIYNRDDVDIVVAEGRSFLQKDQSKYSIISIPLVDTWASTAAGNLTLVESNLYTVEAFEDYLMHLEDDGYLSLTRWEFDGTRLTSLYVAAAERLGITSPEDNIVILSNNFGVIDSLNLYLFKTTAFTEGEMAFLTNHASEQGFDVVYTPSSEGDNQYYDFLRSDDKQAYTESYVTRLEPVYDDNPFYFFLQRFKDVFNPRGLNTIDGGLGYTTVIVMILALIIVFLPKLLQIKSTDVDKKKGRYAYLLYMAALGFSFITIEIALIQKFILYLEYPIYSYSTVLAVMLLSAGVGSYITKYLTAAKKSTYITVGVSIFVLMLFYFLNLHTIIEQTMTYALSVKIIIASIVAAVPSVCMGMMLPLAFTRLNERHMQQLIPWSWALNGSFSVLGSVSAIYMAVAYGFSTTMLIGGIVYLGAVVAMYITFAKKYNS
ncbi:MAG: hypothetical protein ACPGO5_03165 [Patescibacteria group bacterium]